jgi:uncharacterized Zn ribbon protein
MIFPIIICPECESYKVTCDGDFYFCVSCGHRWLREEDKGQFGSKEDS